MGDKDIKHTAVSVLSEQIVKAIQAQFASVEARIDSKLAAIKVSKKNLQPRSVGDIHIAEASISGAKLKEWSDLSARLGMELVWENSTPTVSFVAQNLTLPAYGDEDVCVVVFRHSTANSALGAAFILRQGESCAGGVIGATPVTRSTAFTSSTGVAFGSGYSYVAYGVGAEDNTVAIPMWIYRLKHIPTVSA